MDAKSRSLVEPGAHHLFVHHGKMLDDRHHIWVLYGEMLQSQPKWRVFSKVLIRGRQHWVKFQGVARSPFSGCPGLAGKGARPSRTVCGHCAEQPDYWGTEQHQGGHHPALSPWSPGIAWKRTQQHCKEKRDRESQLGLANDKNFHRGVLTLNCFAGTEVHRSHWVFSPGQESLVPWPTPPGGALASWEDPLDETDPGKWTILGSAENKRTILSRN